MRTPARNWKFGQMDVNVLLLAVIWRGVAIPLLYELLPHGGGSDTEIRHTLMDDALCLLRAADFRVLYADREFVGYDWIQGLARRGIPICVRLRSDMLMDDWTAQDWLSRLQTGHAGLLVDDTVVYGQPINVVLTHTGRTPGQRGVVWKGMFRRFRPRVRPRHATSCIDASHAINAV